MNMDMRGAVETGQQAELETCRVNGCEVCYRVLGEGHPALLHGWGASWHYWQWLLPILARLVEKLAEFNRAVLRFLKNTEM